MIDSIRGYLRAARRLPALCLLGLALAACGGGDEPVYVDQPVEDIYNGADDNASGTSGLIELAEAFSSRSLKAKRTVVFVAFDAEERGLVGSLHYVSEPVVPMEKTRSMLNMGEPHRTVGTDAGQLHVAPVRKQARSYTIERRAHLSRLRPTGLLRVDHIRAFPYARRHACTSTPVRGPEGSGRKEGPAP